MGKRMWLCVLSLSVLLSGCGGSALSDEAVEAAIPEMAAGETAAPVFAEETTEAPLVTDQDGAVRPGIYAYDGSKEDLKTDGLTYFTFTQNAVTHCDEGGEELLLETLAQTTFYSQCAIQTQWINDVLQDIQKSDNLYGNELLEYAKLDKKERGESFYCHSHYVSRGVARHDAHVISLLTQSTVYSGGIQPNMTQTALNLDMKNLKSLTLEDVIHPERCEDLYRLILTKVDEKFSVLGQSALVENYQSIIADRITYGKMTPYWYFNDQGLVIFFNQYELAPNAAGIIKVELGYDLLDGILIESYFPDEIDGWITNLSVNTEHNTGKPVYHVKLGEGETVYITLSGTATHVQLSEVSFVEQTAVASNMLFSANLLNEETTVALTAEPDPEKTYAVSYCDAIGGPKILYFRDNRFVTDLNQ